MSENAQKNKDLNNQVTNAYNETLQYLYRRLAVFHHIGAAAYKPGLDNTIQLMNALNNPQNSYRTIHIAGTNGKGSVSHLLAAVLQKAGYKVGLYTSPHLVDFGERIRVNGEMIEQQFVIDFVSDHKDLFSQIEPSFFEATMALAFDYFAHCKVDIAIIEVGLGGRLDSTNIIQPELSVITNISYDHVEFLGNTLEKIAFEKAGIIKHQIPIVIGEVLPETRTAFELKAKEQEATIIYAEEQIKVKFIAYSDKKMIVETADNKTFKVGLNGIYQLKNIATTLTSIHELQKLNFIISIESILDGIENVVEITGLKGRWQELHQHPLVICDTGHNSAGIEIVAEQLKTLNYNTLRIVIGMVSDKEISPVLALLPTNAIYYFTQANISRALPAQELERKASNFGLFGKVVKSVNEAVTTAMKDADAEDMIFIGGSNFIVGEALPYFQEQKKA